MAYLCVHYRPNFAKASTFALSRWSSLSRSPRQKVVGMRRIPVVLVLLLAATVWPATNSLPQTARWPRTPPPPRVFAPTSTTTASPTWPSVCPRVRRQHRRRRGGERAVRLDRPGLTGTGSQLFTQDSERRRGRRPLRPRVGHRRLRQRRLCRPGHRCPLRGRRQRSPLRVRSTSCMARTAGLTGVDGQLFTQVGGAVEADDFFGFVLAAARLQQRQLRRPGRGRLVEAVGSVIALGR